MSTPSHNPNVTVSLPVDNGSAEVIPVIPGPPCELCEANGTLSHDSLTFLEVYVKIFPGQFTPGEQHKDDTLQHGTPAETPTSTTWRSLGLAGTSCSGWNTLVAVAEWLNNETVEIYDAMDHSRYQANEVVGCSSVSESAPQRPATTWEDVSPTVAHDAWLSYHLTLTNRYFGNRLLLPSGRPLRANAIAATAASVQWHYDPGRYSLIQRPFGNMTLASSLLCLGGHCVKNRAWRFFDAPPYSLVVWQQFAPVRHVVISQKRHDPDIINLEPNCDVFAQLNDSRFPGAYSDNRGTVVLDLLLVP